MWIMVKFGLLCKSSGDNLIKFDLCFNQSYFIRSLAPHSGRLLISLVNDTDFDVEQISENIKCPSTHFECPVSRNCMPVFLRCNGTILLEQIHCPFNHDQ